MLSRSGGAMADRKRAGQREISRPKVEPPTDEEFFAWLAEPVKEPNGPAVPLKIPTPYDTMRRFAEAIYRRDGLPVEAGPLLDAPWYTLAAGQPIAFSVEGLSADEMPSPLCQISGLGELVAGPDTEAALAGRILEVLRMVEIAERDKNTNLMLRTGFELGLWAERYSIEFEYGPMLANIKSLTDARAASATQRVENALVRRAKWQSIADDYFKKHPNSTLGQAAKYIAKTISNDELFRASVNTIRQAIKKKSDRLK